MKPLILIGAMFLSTSVLDFTNPALVYGVRALFVAFAALQYLMWTNVKQRVSQSPNKSQKIWVKEAPAPSLATLMNGFFGETGNTPATYKETTYEAFETEKLDQLIKQATMGPLTSLGLSFFANLHIGLVIQLVSGVYGLFEEALFLKYILRNAKPLPYGELLHDPTAAAPTTATITNADGITKVADFECEEAIFRTWESKEPSEIAIFEHLNATGKPIAKYQTAKDGWSALMVVAASVQNGRKEVSRLLELGFDATLQDEEGFTALHWAALHNCAFGADVICGAFSDQSSGKKAHAGSIADLRTLLAKTDKKGRNALQVAVDEKADAVAGVLREHTARCSQQVEHSSNEKEGVSNTTEEQ